MPADHELLERFHAFVGEQLNRVEAVSPEEAVALFRETDPAPRPERDEAIADVLEGLADEEAGRVIRARDLPRKPAVRSAPIASSCTPSGTWPNGR